MGKDYKTKGGASDRNVDVSLAGPRTKLTFGLAAAHAVLNAHLSSGTWMLWADQESEASRTKRSVTDLSKDLLKFEDRSGDN